jgi:glycosyltransferase involved in cell wall biosynthesis
VGAAYLAGQLALARRLGYGLVWTIHNLQPHERRHPRLYRLVSRLVLRWSVPVVHCQAATGAVRQAFGYDGAIVVAPLGHYAGVYPPAPVARAEARRRLELPANARLFLHVGLIRPYKGIPDLIQQFARLPSSDVALVVAGEEHDSDLAATLSPVLRADPRVFLRLQWIPDEELALYLAAADVVVTAFERVLTSSSVMLAMSNGLPVVAPALGCIPELVGEGGLLYDPADPEGLYRALSAAATGDLEALGRKAYTAALNQSWAQTAAGVLEAYKMARERRQ